MGRSFARGLAVGAATAAAVTAIFVPVRASVGAAPSLLLILPVIVAVAAGGYPAGVAVAVGAGLADDWFFVHPYGSFTIGHTTGAVVLVVYLAVALLVGRAVAVERSSRRRTVAQAAAIADLFQVTQELIGDQPLPSLLQSVVETVRSRFGARWATLLLPESGGLRVAAEAGPVPDDERFRALGPNESPHALTLGAPGADVTRLALTSAQGPIGQLVVAGVTPGPFERELLRTFANQAALAIERAQLQSRAVRSEVLEATEEWRRALLGAVSHDLRTPLTAIKLAASTLLGSQGVSAEDRAALATTIDEQADHLTRLVTNLLDVVRIEAGGLVLHRDARTAAELFTDARRTLHYALAPFTVAERFETDALIDVDVVLITQVLANLLANAAQHAPVGSTITLGASTDGTVARLWVDDEGPGVPPSERERLFHMADRRSGSGRAGLGLTIATAFVAAHGGTLAVDRAPGGGARFVVTLPDAVVSEGEP